MNTVKILIFCGAGIVLLTFGLKIFGSDWISWFWYMMYMAASNSFIALPHEPLVFYYGSNSDIFSTVLLAVLPTIAGCYLDYQVISPVIKSSRLKGLKNRIWLRKLIDYFNRMPFITVAVAALTPVPFYPVRLLSIVSGYPVYKYTTAVLSGRLPRYVFLAAGGKMAGIDARTIIFIFALIILWYIVLQLHNRKGYEGNLG